VTEWVAKGDLTKVLKEGMPIPWSQLVRYAKDAAAAMAYLHQKNIMHRDLKAENMLLTDNDRVKVCDLGFARTTTGLTRTMSYLGTADYMAPEILLGGNYDRKADVFSFGIVLFEIIARQSPPKRNGSTSFAFLDNVLAPLMPADCPQDFKQLTLQCVDKDPAKRPDFKDILHRLKSLWNQLLNEEEVVREKEMEVEAEKAWEEQQKKLLHDTLRAREKKKKLHAKKDTKKLQKAKAKRRRSKAKEKEKEKKKKQELRKKMEKEMNKKLEDEMLRLRKQMEAELHTMKQQMLKSMSPEDFAAKEKHSRKVAEDKRLSKKLTDKFITTKKSLTVRDKKRGDRKQVSKNL